MDLFSGMERALSMQKKQQIKDLKKSFANKWRNQRGKHKMRYRKWMAKCGCNNKCTSDTTPFGPKVDECVNKCVKECKQKVRAKRNKKKGGKQEKNKQQQQGPKKPPVVEKKAEDKPAAPKNTTQNMTHDKPPAKNATEKSNQTKKAKRQAKKVNATNATNVSSNSTKDTGAVSNATTIATKSTISNVQAAQAPNTNALNLQEKMVEELNSQIREKINNLRKQRQRSVVPSTSHVMLEQAKKSSIDDGGAIPTPMDYLDE